MKLYLGFNEVPRDEATGRTMEVPQGAASAMAFGSGVSGIPDLAFPPETEVVAVPPGERQRFWLPKSDVISRWKLSRFFPATRLSGKARRLALRALAQIGAGSRRAGSSTGANLLRVAENEVGERLVPAALLGTPGADQKLVVELRSARTGDPIAYAKIAWLSVARQRLAHESAMLSRIPLGVGPELLADVELSEGVHALILSSVAGRPPSASWAVPTSLRVCLDALVEPAKYVSREHPGITPLRGYTCVSQIEDALSQRMWPVAVEHGDLAPWNVLSADGETKLIDWEYGTVVGFPYLDEVHYLLQISCLLRRDRPAVAAREIGAQLAGSRDLSGTEAHAITRLAALRAYHRAASDGVDPAAGVQLWRKAIWCGAAN